jgi:hypothetical protein
MSATPILHMLVALAYLLAGRAATRDRQHHTALHDLHLAMLYTMIALIDVPLIDLATALPGPLQHLTPAIA